MNASSLILKNISICNNLIYRTQFGDEYIKIQVNLNFTLLQCVRVWVACSQTLYFLFNVRRGRVIKFKPEGIYWPPAQGGSGGGGSRALALLASSLMFLKRTKRKIKQRLCTGYNPGQKGLGHCSYPLPFLVGNWWVTVNLQLSIWLCLGFRPPPE